MSFWVYILASRRNGTLYAGHTENLPERIWQHRSKARKGFTARHDVSRLVWMEPHPTREAAKLRERQIKAWKRLWKLKLIEERNPDWTDLYPDLVNWWSKDA
ncbi:MAG: GIY-YIG nuclease family protein [Hyphomonadaceae bacterium]